MYKLYKTAHSGPGTTVEVHIDKENKLIRRHYKEDAITCSGYKTQMPKTGIRYSFMNETYWLKKLESKWIPKTVNIDYSNRIIIQEYTHPDLLYIKPRLKEVVPDIVEQVIEMYTFFKSKNVYKCNGSLSNLTLRGNQLVAFDFKWAKYRPYGKKIEIKSYNDWLVKIDSSLPSKLKELL